MSMQQEPPVVGGHLNWYLIYTKPRQERIAETNLLNQGYECYLPLIPVRKIRRKRLEVVEEALFPRYLFVRLDNSGEGMSWSPIRSTLGVSRLVKFGDRHAIVDDGLIEFLRHRQAALTAPPLFNPGDTVLITEGPFSGLEAIYHTQDGEQRASILIQMLNRPLNIRIALSHLRKNT